MQCPRCHLENPPSTEVCDCGYSFATGSYVAGNKKAPLFQTAKGRTQQLTGRRMSQPEVYLMVRRRAVGSGIATKIGNHTFRATGITAYLKNGGKLEVAQQMAGHESARTTGLYDRRNDSVALDEVERIAYEVDHSAI